MRALTFGLSAFACLAIAGCSDPAREPPPADGVVDGVAEGASGTCVAAVAAHVGRPAAEVRVVAATAETVTVRDGDRIHRCDMAGGRLLAIVHPGAVD